MIEAKHFDSLYNKTKETQWRSVCEVDFVGIFASEKTFHQHRGFLSAMSAIVNQKAISFEVVLSCRLKDQSGCSDPTLAPRSLFTRYHIVS